MKTYNIIARIEIDALYEVQAENRQEANLKVLDNAKDLGMEVLDDKITILDSDAYFEYMGGKHIGTMKATYDLLKDVK